MAQTEQGRLTEGPILKVLTKLALPIMASSFLSTAYSITDMAWIGTLGAKAVAGVGVGGMYVWLSQGLASLARMGGQVHVAQELGRGDRERAKKYSAAAIQLVIFFGVLFGAVCLLFSRSAHCIFWHERYRDTDPCKELSDDYLWDDCFFVCKFYAYGAVYGTGRRYDAVSG